MPTRNESDSVLLTMQFLNQLEIAQTDDARFHESSVCNACQNQGKCTTTIPVIVRQQLFGSQTPSGKNFLVYGAIMFTNYEFMKTPGR